MQRYAIIVAGGKGLRMQADVPKQFMLINGKPLLHYTLEAFLKVVPKVTLIVVLPKDHMLDWQHISATKGYTVVEGGATRYDSVKNGLRLVPEGVLVAVHDGARPLITKKIIAEGFNLLNTVDACIPVVPVQESLRMLVDQGKSNTTVDRSLYKIVQTPQFFRSSILKYAYETTPFTVEITDDASLVERSGIKIEWFEGDPQNIKITTPADLAFFKNSIPLD